jgi:hypothetical protein
MMRARRAIVLSVFLSAIPALGQVATTQPAPTAGSTKSQEWSFSTSAYAYAVADSRNFVQPTFTADRGPLHLQMRYNYENLETGSAWIGYNFEAGDRLTFKLTPEVGGIFGDTNGIAPGWGFSLNYWRLELYSESEYVFDLGSKSGNFFYTWSELSISPTDWFRAGLVAQRTRAYQTDVDVQRGLLFGVSFKKLDVTSYIFNPDREKQTYVFSVSVEF